MHQIKVDYRIVGFTCKEEEITDLIGLKPTKVKVKGEPISPNGDKLRSENLWQIESCIDDNLHLDTHLNQLQETMTPYLDQFREMGKKYYCEFACSIYLRTGAEESIPSIHISRSFSQFIAEINAELDIDIIGY